MQANVPGFGDPKNNSVTTIASFDNHLYAATYNYQERGTQLWRLDSLDWTAVFTNGFGNPHNVAIDHLFDFNGHLYAGTWNAINGGELWRNGDGLSWTQVISWGFGDPTNGELTHFTTFSNTLYVATWSYTTTHSTEVWRSDDDLAWTRVVSNGFNDDPNNAAVYSFETYNGYLFASTRNLTTGGEVKMVQIGCRSILTALVRLITSKWPHSPTSMAISMPV